MAQCSKLTLHQNQSHMYVIWKLKLPFVSITHAQWRPWLRSALSYLLMQGTQQVSKPVESLEFPADPNEVNPPEFVLLPLIPRKRKITHIHMLRHVHSHMQACTDTRADTHTQKECIYLRTCLHRITHAHIESRKEKIRRCNKSNASKRLIL